MFRGYFYFEFFQLERRRRMYRHFVTRIPWKETFRCEATEFVFTTNWLCFGQNFMQKYPYSIFKRFENIEVSFWQFMSQFKTLFLGLFEKTFSNVLGSRRTNKKAKNLPSYQQIQKSLLSKRTFSGNTQ